MASFKYFLKREVLDMARYMDISAILLLSVFASMLLSHFGPFLGALGQKLGMTKIYNNENIPTLIPYNAHNHL